MEKRLYFSSPITAANASVIRHRATASWGNPFGASAWIEATFTITNAAFPSVTNISRGANGAAGTSISNWNTSVTNRTQGSSFIAEARQTITVQNNVGLTTKIIINQCFLKLWERDNMNNSTVNKQHIHVLKFSAVSAITLYFMIIFFTQPIAWYVTDIISSLTIIGSFFLLQIYLTWIKRNIFPSGTAKSEIILASVVCGAIFLWMLPVSSLYYWIHQFEDVFIYNAVIIATNLIRAGMGFGSFIMFRRAEFFYKLVGSENFL